jgi:hypothetical protein
MTAHSDVPGPARDPFFGNLEVTYLRSFAFIRGFTSARAAPDGAGRCDLICVSSVPIGGRSPLDKMDKTQPILSHHVPNLFEISRVR